MEETKEVHITVSNISGDVQCWTEDWDIVEYLEKESNIEIKASGKSDIGFNHWMEFEAVPQECNVQEDSVDLMNEWMNDK